MVISGCWTFVIHTATWEGSELEEADGPARKDVVWNEEQCVSNGQWDLQHRVLRSDFQKMDEM